MTRPLRRMGAVVMVLFGLLLLNVNYLQAYRADDLRSDPGNARTLLEEYQRERGPILVGNDEVASSEATNDQLRFLRRYPDGQLYASATGFYSFVYGATGIEKAESSLLAGTDARLFVRRIGDLITGRAQQGGAVTLTINAKAQQAAFEGLAGRRGAVVALDPTTGAILALVSSPSYNPNLLTSHDGARIRANYARLNADADQPMLNRALNQTYPPGSTFKIVTLSAALSSGKFTPTGPVPGPAQLDLPLTSANLPNFDNRPCSPGGRTTLTVALRRSCNTTFGYVALQLGAPALLDQARKFGFGQGIDVPLDVAGSSFPASPNAPQTAQSGIGQFDVQATPLQMAMVAAGIANNGVVMRPYLVQQVQAPDLSVLDRTDPQELSTAVDSAVAARIRAMMVDVVAQGTGSNGRISGVTVAGKTGTAQVGGNRKAHAWFVSFAPADPGAEAKVAVAVVLENGGGAAEVSGNALAAPIARNVMRAVVDKSS